MPWNEQSIMDHRLCFIAAHLRDDEPMSRLCDRYGISRKTGYKWLERYRVAGAAGLHDLSSARHTISHAIASEIAAAVLQMRADRPTWGARKLLARLAQDHPETTWPAASTVGDLLRRVGLSQPRPPVRGTCLGRLP